jgi:hypothetical protein
MKMKAVMLSLVIVTIAAALAIDAAAYTAPEPVHSPKLVNLKGTWFLRGTQECIPIELDRQGRSEMLLGMREVYIDKTDDYLYLTIKKWPYTYTYRMVPLVWGQSYTLELMTVGPDNPPEGASAPKLVLTGAFRAMVDCQLGVAPIEGGDSRVQEVAVPPGS